MEGIQDFKEKFALIHTDGTIDIMRITSPGEDASIAENEGEGA